MKQKSLYGQSVVQMCSAQSYHALWVMQRFPLGDTAGDCVVYLQFASVVAWPHSV